MFLNCQFADINIHMYLYTYEYVYVFRGGQTKYINVRLPSSLLREGRTLFHCDVVLFLWFFSLLLALSCHLWHDGYQLVLPPPPPSCLYLGKYLATLCLSKFWTEIFISSWTENIYKLKINNFLLFPSLCQSLLPPFLSLLQSQYCHSKSEVIKCFTI